MIIKTKSFRYNWCRFTYRRLTPDLFLTQQYPLAMFSEIAKSNKSDDEKIKDLKEYIRPVIEKGLLKVSRLGLSLKINIDEIMEEYELYTKLYTKIVQFTFKKKTLI